jgi:hypothetical protein
MPAPIMYGTPYDTENKWHNATTADIAALDSQISAKNTELIEALGYYDTAVKYIQSVNNVAPFLNSAKLHALNSARRTRDQYAPIVAKLKSDLQDLQARRASFVAEVNASALLGQQIAITSTATAEANKTIAETEKVQATATASKVGVYALIGVGILVVVVGGIFAFKYFKKK